MSVRREIDGDDAAAFAAGWIAFHAARERASCKDDNQITWFERGWDAAAIETAQRLKNLDPIMTDLPLLVSTLNSSRRLINTLLRHSKLKMTLKQRQEATLTRDVIDELTTRIEKQNPIAVTPPRGAAAHG